MKKRILIVLGIIIITFLALIIGIKILDIINFKCVFKYFFGIYCPGCGTTRMFKAMLKLNFKKAFMYNPFMFILFMIILIYVAYNMYTYITKKKIKLPSLTSIVIIVILSFIFMIIRNLPGFRFLRI